MAIFPIFGRSALFSSSSHNFKIIESGHFNEVQEEEGTLAFISMVTTGN